MSTASSYLSPRSPVGGCFSRLICMLVLFLLCPVAHAHRFATTPAYLPGTSPLWVAVGDFNRDGIPDLATVNDRQISVLLGKGKGKFREPRNYEAGAYPDSIATADFNGDGILDLVVANSDSGTVSVLLGKGDGTFRRAVSYPAGTNPSYLVVGDFNGDGNSDVAVVNATPVYRQMETISVLLGKGDGTLQSPKLTTVDYYLTYAAVADFNKDGKQDLVISAASYNSVPEMDVLLGNGDGTFNELPPISVDSALLAPGGIAIADFNGDGNPDFAVVAASGVNVLLGDGTGRFATPQVFPADLPLGTVVAGDLNGDGKPDLVVANQSSNDVSVLLGNGDGTFQTAVNYCSGAPNNYVIAADINGDSKLDVAVGTVYALTTIFGNGDGTLQTQINYGASVNGLALAGDLNGDGIPDVLAGYNDEELQSFLGNGDGTFRALQRLGTGGTENVLGDFNNDAKLDVAMEFSDGGPEVQVLFGTGDGGFWGEGPAQQIGPDGGNLIAADFNRDGNLDLAVAGFANQGGDVAVLLGNGDGSFQKPAIYDADQGPWNLAAADLNGDGIPDLAVANQNSNDVSILIGKGDGSFDPPVNYPAGAYPYCVAAGDFNGDGKLDLIICNNGAPGLTLLLGNGDGTFQPGTSFGDAEGCYGVAVADFDGDGKLDIAAYCAFLFFIRMPQSIMAMETVLSGSQRF